MTNLRVFNDEAAYDNAVNKEPITISYIKSVDEVKYDQWENYIEMIYEDDQEVVEGLDTVLFPIATSGISYSILEPITEIRYDHKNIPLEEISASENFAYEFGNKVYGNCLLKQNNTTPKIGKHILHIRIDDNSYTMFSSSLHTKNNSLLQFQLDGQGEDNAIYSNMVLNLSKLKCDTIGESAFHYCTKLTTIMLPETLTIVEKCAFDNCENLNEIYFYSKNAPTFDTLANFVQSLPNSGSIYLRKDANMDGYRALVNTLNTYRPNWSVFYEL